MEAKDRFTRFVETYEFPKKSKELSNLEDRIDQYAALSYEENKEIPGFITISAEEYKWVEDYTREVDMWDLRTGTRDPFRCLNLETVLGTQTPWGFIELRVAKEAEQDEMEGQEMIVVTGKVYEREIDYGNSNEFISEIRDENDCPLSDTLEDLVGKKVKVTIVVID